MLWPVVSTQCDVHWTTSPLTRLQALETPLATPTSKSETASSVVNIEPFLSSIYDAIRSLQRDGKIETAPIAVKITLPGDRVVHVCSGIDGKYERIQCFPSELAVTIPYLPSNER